MRHSGSNKCRVYAGDNDVAMDWFLLPEETNQFIASSLNYHPSFIPSSTNDAKGLQVTEGEGEHSSSNHLNDSPIWSNKQKQVSKHVYSSIEISMNSSCQGVKEVEVVLLSQQIKLIAILSTNHSPSQILIKGKSERSLPNGTPVNRVSIYHMYVYSDK